MSCRITPPTLRRSQLGITDCRERKSNSLKFQSETLQARMRGIWAPLQLLHVLAAVDRDIGTGHERRLVRA